MPVRKVMITLFCIFFLAGCKTPEPELARRPFNPTDRPKNIVLMIGDGMGLSQISAALYTNNNQLNIEQFPVVGFHKSHSFDNLVTDSAAGATAFACGVKTYNNAIGVDADTVACKSILEEAEENAMATGLLSTSTIVHATPASFIAHQKLRVMYEDIASDFLKTDIDLIIGGGKRYFDRREFDDRDLYRELEDKGYIVSDYSKKDLNRITFSPNQKYAYFTADKQPIPVTAGRRYLPIASKMAVNYLQGRSNKGFFLMIEGAQIDWAGHANDGKLMIKETLDFDQTIGEILAFAKKKGDTLVIITADHETGGLALNPGSKFGKITPAFTTNGHTASLIPVFAYGPSAHLFSGIYDNTEIHKKMREALGFGNTAASR